MSLAEEALFVGDSLETDVRGRPGRRPACGPARQSGDGAPVEPGAPTICEPGRLCRS